MDIGRSETLDGEQRCSWYDIVQQARISQVRHLDIQATWIHQKVPNEDLELYQAGGCENTAHVVTNPNISVEHMSRLMEELGCVLEDGRAETAPALRR